MSDLPAEVRAEPANTRGPSLSAWQVVGTFIAPTTTLTALLLYFGWIRASTTYGYFGIDVERTLGFSASDYVRRSSSVVFTPLAALVLISFAVLLSYQLAEAYLARREHSFLLRRITVGTTIAAAGFLLAAAILLLEIDLLAEVPLVTPLTLGIGALLAGYAAHLKGLAVGARHKSGAGRPLAEVLYFGLLGALLVLALFWATSIVARDQGLGVAHSIEGHLDERTGAVVYSHDILYISGPGVKFTALDPTNSAYRFRYTGLRFLARTADGGYVLLPRGWTHKSGNPVYVLPPGGVRVDLQALPAD